MDWKAILSLAVLIGLLVTPVAYCEMNTQAMKHEERIACIQAGGDWGKGWGPPSCGFTD
jgi:hypothetical protein